MSDDRLTDLLAARVMGWRLAPGRYLGPDRNWIPRWRFQPLEDFASAFDLLGHAADYYTITCNAGTFSVEIRVGTGLVKATGDHLPRIISLAIAKSVGLEVGD